MDLAKLGLALQAGGLGFMGGNPNSVIQPYLQEQQDAETSQKVAGMLSGLGIQGPQADLISSMPLGMQQQYLMNRMQTQEQDKMRRRAAAEAASIRQRQIDSQNAAFAEYLPKPIPDAQGPTIAAANKPMALSREAIGRAITDPRLSAEQRKMLMDAYEFQNPVSDPKDQIIEVDGTLVNVADPNNPRPVYAAPEDPQTTTAFQTLEARANAAGLKPGTPPYEQFMLTGGRQETGFTVSQDADGGWRIEQGPLSMMRGDGPVSVPNEPERLGRKISENDAGLLKTAQEQAAAADNLNMNMAEAERIMLNGMNTGLGTGARAQASRVGAALGLSQGKFAENFQALDRVSKAIGIDTLRAMGGNDTERELMTAIQTTVNPGSEEGANFRVIANQKAAADVISQKPNLMAAWLDEFGSLNNSNDKGETWDSAWRKYQVEEYRKLAEQYAKGFGLDQEPTEGGGPWPIDNDPPPEGISPDTWRWVDPESRAMWK